MADKESVQSSSPGASSSVWCLVADPGLSPGAQHIIFRLTLVLEPLVVSSSHTDAALAASLALLQGHLQLTSNSDVGPKLAE